MRSRESLGIRSSVSMRDRGEDGDVFHPREILVMALSVTLWLESATAIRDGV